jgi:sugar (pentulose or hexulose) kinase
MHLIGLDIGTTGCKAIVFSPEGRMLGRGFREYEVVCRAPAMAEQDAEHVWNLTREVLKEAVAQSGVNDLAALSLSVQGDAVIPIDRELRALHPAILGMDYRSQRQAADCEAKCGAFELFRRTGMRAHPMNSVTKILLLRELAPAVFGRAWKFVTYADFILGKLGDEPVIDHPMASRTMAFDLAAGRWSAEILEPLGLAADRLSPPVASGCVAGTIRKDLAQELGVPTTLALVSGGHDQTCAALGAGAVREGLGVVSTGTAEVLSTAFRSPVLTREMFESYYPCYRHAKAGMFFTFALNHVGGILLKWHRDNFGLPEASEARASGADPYERIVARMPAGPSPLMVIPHWNGSGTPRCDLQAKGAILGLTMASTRHDVAKAILEGLTFELLINLQTMRQCGIRVDELAAVGGGAKSSLWLQLKADILNRPIRTLRCREAACLGAALLAGTATGVYASLDDAVRRTVAYDREFLPEATTAALYQERFATYRKLYPALRPINPEL